MTPTPLTTRTNSTGLTPTESCEEPNATVAPALRTVSEEPRLLPVRTTIPAGRVSRILHRGLMRVMDRTTRTLRGIRREIDGLDRLEKTDKPFIIACNHLSLLDSPMIHLSLPRRHARRTAVVGGLDFFAPRSDLSMTENLWRRWVIRFIRGAVNVVLINRSGGDYSNLEQIETLVSEGWNLVIFPEATRSRSGEPGRMRLGVAELARRHDCTVLPTSIEGTDVVLPVGATFPRRGTMRIRIGEPIEIEPSESSRSFIERLGARIVRLQERGADA